MPSRLLFAAVALAALTAFAPAPFPRPRRESNAIDLTSFQGTWRLVRQQVAQAGGTYHDTNIGVTHIRVVRDRWTFLNKGGTENASYFLKLDSVKKPCPLDFSGEVGGRVQMMGIIRRRGQTVEVLYRGGTNVRPESFEKPPQGYYLLTL